MADSPRFNMQESQDISRLLMAQNTSLMQQLEDMKQQIAALTAAQAQAASPQAVQAAMQPLPLQQQIAAAVQQQQQPQAVVQQPQAVQQPVQQPQAASNGAIDIASLQAAIAARQAQAQAEKPASSSRILSDADNRSDKPKPPKGFAQAAVESFEGKLYLHVPKLKPQNGKGKPVQALTDTAAAAYGLQFKPFFPYAYTSTYLIAHKDAALAEQTALAITQSVFDKLK